MIANFAYFQRPGIACCWICLLMLLTASCAPRTPPSQIQGRVVVNNLPADGVYLLFRLKGSTMDPATIQTNGEGEYQWEVPAPGEYIINAMWPERVTVDGDTTEGPDRFRDKYLQPATPAATVEVYSGSTQLPVLELTTR